MQNITITDAVTKKITELQADDKFKDEPIKGLRVYVQGGGCSGFSYEFAFETKISDDDIIFEKDGVKIIVDPMSIPFLTDATIDYKIDLLNERFIVDNPSACSTCSCGASFSI